MKVLVTASARFVQTQDSVLWTDNSSLAYHFWARYLAVFEEVELLVRARFQNSRPDGWVQVSGIGIVPVATPYFVGPFEYAKKYLSVNKLILSRIAQAEAIQLRVPCTLGNHVWRKLDSGRPYGVEVVGDPQDVYASQANSHPLRQFFRWWFAHNLKQQCAHATAAAYVTSEALQKRYPPNPKAFTTHYSSIQLTEEAFIKTPPLQRIGAQKDVFTLVHVGTMAQLYKAQDDLIRAVHHCLAQGFNIRLILVGDGKHRVDLEGLVKKLGLSGHVCFCGQLPAGEAVRQQLDQADLFVMPSRQEGLPRAMVEAMARGLACIGTNMGGIPELLEAENLVPVNDSAALAQKIQEVLLDSERRRRMAQRNWEVATCYRTEVLQVRRESLYTHLKERTFEWMQQRKSEE
jgi:glycosyltransferase involved in cell wall biosynthesis